MSNRPSYAVSMRILRLLQSTILGWNKLIQFDSILRLKLYQIASAMQKHFKKNDCLECGRLLPVCSCITERTGRLVGEAECPVVA